MAEEGQHTSQARTCSHGCSGGNGRYDLASYQLGFELVNLRNLVVARPHVG